MTSVLMVQGTQSNAGKTVFVTGLCRLLTRRGIRVAPFKPQNMSLNSAVTTGGGEISRAQALQAQACGLAPSHLMNPVLLKPNSEQGAQIIVQGKSIGNMSATEYHQYKPKVLDAVLTSFHALAEAHDFIVIEGAGSPAEINLREHDIANMGFAEAVNCPVLLIANIDPGGVFAQIVGTLAVLSQSEQNRIRGFVINQFRGDIQLLKSGLAWLEKHSHKTVFGVLPFIKNLYLDAEDSLIFQTQQHKKETQFRIVIPRLPRISNHTDFEALRSHPQIELVFSVEPDIPADLIILPGSKNVAADLHWLLENQWLPWIKKHLRYGGKLMGICGGFQMLGLTITDPHGMESAPGSHPGLKLIDMHTVLAKEKILRLTQGRWCIADAEFKGYEIHLGQSEGRDLNNPAMITDNGPHGVVSDDGQILGTYVHGVFDHQESMQALFNWAGFSASRAIDYNDLRERHINRVADCIEENVDTEQLLRIAAEYTGASI